MCNFIIGRRNIYIYIYIYIEFFLLLNDMKEERLN
jgi:hypothetical protein